MHRLLWIILFLPALSSAQGKINLHLFGGFANYSGDLQEKRFTIGQSHLAFGAGVGYAIIPKLQLKLNINYARISADDKNSSRLLLKERNLNFHTAILEGNLLLDYTFLDLELKRVSPYIFAGAGLYHFNPYSFDSLGLKVDLRPLSTEGQGINNKPYYPLTQLAIPFGGGIRIRINDNTYLAYEIGTRKLFTDHFDDVSGVYVDQTTLRNARGQLAVDMAFRGDEVKSNPTAYPPAGTTRGGFKYRDWYYFSGLTLSIGLMPGDGRLFGGGNKRGRTDCPTGL